MAAAESTVPGLAAKEVAKREARLAEGQRLVAESGSSFEKGDYTAAMKAARDAWELLPDAPATAPLRMAARDACSRASLAQARKLAREARYAESKQVIDTVLAADFDPENAEAKVFKSQLDDPDRFNPALTPQQIRNVAEVNSLLMMGGKFSELGQYEEAIVKFQAVLAIDKYNTAARQGMEKVERLRKEYFDSARDHTRAHRLAEVDSGWESGLPSAAADISGLFGGQTAGRIDNASAGKDDIVSKLRSYIISTVNLQGATLEETVEFLRIRSRDLDPKHQGIGFVLRVPDEAKNKPINLTLSQVPLEELLRYVTQMSGTAYRVDEFAVTITSLAEKSTTLVTRSWRVPPDFISRVPAGDAGAPSAPPDPFATKGTGKAASTTLMPRFGAREFLEQRGVAFPGDASASYNPSTNILFVRNTVENLAIIDDLVEQAMGATPKLVEIRVRIVEIGDTRMNELGFDSMVGQFNLPGSSSVFGSGGTVGNGRSSNFTNQDFPITGPGPAASPIGTFPITSGLRSSGAILGTSSITGLLSQNSPIDPESRSPGQLALAGVFTDPQFQTVLRTLSQKKGKDVLSVPAVVTKSGQRASINISREFIYPTEFTPPQIPTNIGSGASRIPITPTNPSAFNKRDVGVTLEVEPVVAANNSSIDLSVAPNFTDFEGFINYGSDIQTYAGTNLFGGAVYGSQPNPIIQPIFRTNKCTAAVTIYDGSTVAMAGLVQSRRQDIQDKVPVIGDLPLVGRAFQSKVSLLENKHLVFFVTARLLDPSGNALKQPAPATAAAP